MNRGLFLFPGFFPSEAERCVAGAQAALFSCSCQQQQRSTASLAGCYDSAEETRSSPSGPSASALGRPIEREAAGAAEATAEEAAAAVAPPANTAEHGGVRREHICRLTDAAGAR